MIDVDGVDGITLYESYTDPDEGRFNRPARIWFTYRDRADKSIDFDSDDAARAMYESLFSLLMPEIAQALKEEQNVES